VEEGLPIAWWAGWHFTETYGHGISLGGLVRLVSEVALKRSEMKCKVIELEQ